MTTEETTSISNQKILIKIAELAATGSTQPEILSALALPKNYFRDNEWALEGWRDGRRHAAQHMQKALWKIATTEVDSPAALSAKVRACEIMLDRLFITKPSRGAKPAVRAEKMLEAVEREDVSVKQGHQYMQMLGDAMKITQIEDLKKLIGDFFIGVAGAKTLDDVRASVAVGQKHLESI